MSCETEIIVLRFGNIIVISILYPKVLNLCIFFFLLRINSHVNNPLKNCINGNQFQIKHIAYSNHVHKKYIFPAFNKMGHVTETFIRNSICFLLLLFLVCKILYFNIYYLTSDNKCATRTHNLHEFIITASQLKKKTQIQLGNFACGP